MFCKNCGNQLNGSENVCPKCGAVVEKENNDIASVQQSTPVAETNPAVTNTTNPVAPNPGVAMPTPAQQAPKNNTTLILVILLVGLLIAGSIVFFAMKNKESDSGSGSDSDVVEPSGDSGNGSGSGGDIPDEPDPVVSTDDGKASYGGYTFEIPTGYKSEQDSSVGLIVSNNDIAFSIKVDTFNSYDDYVTYFKEEYASQISSMERTISGKKYIIIPLNEDGVNFIQYVTTSKDNSAVFTGAIVRSDGKVSGTTELNLLATTLNTGSASSSFAAGDKTDSGTNEIIDYGKSNIDFGKLK